jgi:hypothetical protein
MMEARKSDLEIFRNEDALTKLAALHCEHTTRRIRLLLLSITLCIAFGLGAAPPATVLRWIVGY